MGEFVDLVKKRRSVYSISSASSINDAQLEDMLTEIILSCPTAYNMQSSQLVLLLNHNHQRLWSIVLETLRKSVPPDRFARTEQKINSFAAGYGTVLFFNDDDITNGVSAQMPSYKETFATWAQQQNGMLQFAVWTALASKGMGASLQHYNPIIDDEVRSTWNLPQSWQLIAQMPFGITTAPPDAKEKRPAQDRIAFFK